MLTVGIIDCNTLLTNGIELFLKSQNMSVVTCSEDVEDLKSKEKDVDVFICELKEKSIHKVSLQEKIKKPILFVLTNFDKITFLKLVDSKIFGYMTNDNSFDELIIAIDTLTQGKKYFSNKILNSKESIHTFLELNSKRNIKPQILTKREIEVVDLLKKGFKVKQIAQKLELSPRTVSKHKENVMLKLNTREMSVVFKYFEENYS